MTLATIALLAQLCNPLSIDNGTLYSPSPGGMRCLDWDQTLCAYVERPCRVAELGILCYYVPSTCAVTVRRGVVITPAPKPRTRPLSR